MVCNPCIYCPVAHTVSAGTEVIATIPLTSVPSNPILAPARGAPGRGHDPSPRASIVSDVGNRDIPPNRSGNTDLTGWSGKAKVEKLPRRKRLAVWFGCVRSLRTQQCA